MKPNILNYMLIISREDRHASKIFLFQLSTAEWKDEEDKKALDEFKAEVIERMIEPPWYSDYAKMNNISVSRSSTYIIFAL